MKSINAMSKRRHAYIDQLSEYDDDSSNNSDDFAVEEDCAIYDMQNKELGFLFCITQNKVDGK